MKRRRLGRKKAKKVVKSGMKRHPANRPRVRRGGWRL